MHSFCTRSIRLTCLFVGLCCGVMMLCRQPEKIDDIMDNMEDQKDLSNQISEALTRNTEDMFDDVSC
jgi:hypothetical protein